MAKWQQTPLGFRALCGCLELVVRPSMQKRRRAGWEAVVCDQSGRVLGSSRFAESDEARQGAVGLAFEALRLARREVEELAEKPTMREMEALPLPDYLKKKDE